MMLCGLIVGFGLIIELMFIYKGELLIKSIFSVI